APGAGAGQIVGPDSAVTWRLGQDKPQNGMLRDGSGWLGPGDVLGKQIIIATAFSDLSTLIRPLGHCVLFNTFKPRYAVSFGEEVDKRYKAVNGHLNAMGIYRAPDGGEVFLRAAMKKGM